MAAVETRSLSQIADVTCADDLHAEYVQLTDRIASDPALSTLHGYAILAAVAIARVKALELER